ARCGFLFRSRRGIPHRRQPFPGDAGALAFDRSALGFHAGLRRTNFGELPIDFRPPRIRKSQHWLVKKSMQKPDEDREVGRLEREG
ncbi:MAG TPA: hypothetical protein VME45_15970, partial [Stellaceae bacterium]|nr:hypothetical protein [Stellaceae bacterium]